MIPKELITALPSLSRLDLVDLKARIDALLSLGGGAAEAMGRNPDASWILQCIAITMENRGLGFPNLRVLRQSDAYAQFCHEEVPLLLRFLQRAQLSNARVRRGVVMIGLQKLARDLDKWGVPVMAKTLMQNLHHLPGALNRAFPGYARSAVLSMIVQEKQRGSTVDREIGRRKGDRRRHQPQGTL